MCDLFLCRYPPSPTVYRFLNSGGYIGLAGELVSMLQQALKLTAPFWTTADDQSVYASWFLHNFYDLSTTTASSRKRAGPVIKLDYCQDIFATLSGTPQTAQFSTLEVKPHVGINHKLTGTNPIVAHMPGRSKRFDDFVSFLSLK
jgi:hypothetical protein